MDRNLKKLRKSIKVPKWNPNDWKIGEKLKKKINTRKWDDINVGSGWAELEDKKGRQDGGRRELLSQPSSPRRTTVFTDLQAQSRPVLLPEEGSVFLKKSKPVFFSSLGRMHESCGTLTVSRPPVTPSPQPPPQQASPKPTQLSSSPSASPPCSMSGTSGTSGTSEASNSWMILGDGRGSESSEESESNIVLDSSDSSEDEDIPPHKPVSDPAVVFSAKIENSQQATEILIEAEQFWHDGSSDDQEETLRTSLNLRVRKRLRSIVTH